MKHVRLKLDDNAFNLIWRSLHDRETVLQDAIANGPEGSDEAAMLANDLVYRKPEPNGAGIFL